MYAAVDDVAEGGDSPGRLRLKGQKPKYVVTDHTGLLANRGNATLELGWNVQPWVGAQLWRPSMSIGAWRTMDGGRSEPFAFPDVKSKEPSMDTVRGAESNRGRPA
jgi:signal peptidase complex subunit 3